MNKQPPKVLYLQFYDDDGTTDNPRMDEEQITWAADQPVDVNDVKYFRADTAEAEAASLREQLAQAKADNRRSICVYCGKVQQYEEAVSWEVLKEDIIAHTEECPTHPIHGALEAEDLREQLDEASGYLSRLLKSCYPTIEPLDTLAGLCTQVDNGLAVGLAQLREQLAAKETEYQCLGISMNELRVSQGEAIAMQVRLNCELHTKNQELAERLERAEALLRHCVDEALFNPDAVRDSVKAYFTTREQS